MDFQIGYFEGRGSAKRWISSDWDLTKMYSLFEPGRSITLWCDGVDENEKENKPPVKKKRTEGSSDKSKSDSSEKAGGGSKREVAEEELKGIVEQLRTKHKDLALPQVRLWGKMIQAGQCDSYDTPPDIQLIRGCPVPAKPKKESMVDIIAGAATAVVKAFQQGSPAAGSTPTSAGKLQLCVSPYVRAHTHTHHHTPPPHTHTTTHTHHHTHTHTRTPHTSAHTHSAASLVLCLVGCPGSDGSCQHLITETLMKLSCLQLLSNWTLATPITCDMSLWKPTNIKTSALLSILIWFKLGYFIFISGQSLLESEARSKMSPMKLSRHLRRSCLEDLERLKKLSEEGVLSDKEFTEEEYILSSLKNLR